MWLLLPDEHAVKGLFQQYAETGYNPFKKDIAEKCGLVVLTPSIGSFKQSVYWSKAAVMTRSLF